MIMILRYGKQLLVRSYYCISAEFDPLLKHYEYLRLLSSKNIENMSRGAFIVVEGLDRAGKSTQVTMLLETLKKHSIAVENLVFPNRSTACGKIINDYLTKQIELPLEAVHMLFSANRWELRDKIYEILNKGTTLIVDRYAASGAAYNAATTNRSLEQCRVLDVGLPKPDLVLFLEISEDVQQVRAEWGAERFERAEIQRKVRENFKGLAELDSWSYVDANRPLEEVHANILEKALAIIKDCRDKPIGKLQEIGFSQNFSST